MALAAWVLIWELALLYAAPLLKSPADAGLLVILMALGLGAGHYGLQGRYWQTVAWLFALTWYTAGLARYLPAVDPLLATAPEPLPLLITLLYMILLPMGWLLMVSVGAAGHWWRNWRYRE